MKAIKKVIIITELKLHIFTKHHVFRKILCKPFSLAPFLLKNFSNFVAHIDDEKYRKPNSF